MGSRGSPADMTNHVNRPKKVHATFMTAEIVRVHQYLVKFRDLSRYYCCSLQSSSSNTITILANEEDAKYNTVTMIGGHEFPPLNSLTCTQPFLALPSTLSSKHRRIIHELCLDIDGIFHDSLGPKQHHSNTTTTTNSASEEEGITDASSGISLRIMLISIFVDGIEHHKEWKGETSSRENTNKFSFPLMRCKSWYYLNHDDHHTQQQHLETTTNTTQRSKPSLQYMYWAEHYCHVYSHLKSKKFVQDETNMGLRSIRLLMNQPDHCLRENIDDKIPNQKIHNDNLSNIPKPCIHDNNIFLLVDTVEKMHICISELNSPQVHEVAFDVEAHNASKWTQVTCLLQLSTNVGKDYVIDVLAPGLWDTLSLLLKPLFANPAIVKVGHNMGGLDIASLHRDFGIVVVNAFDTQVAAETLKLHGHYGLAKLCEYYGLTDSVEYHALKQVHQMQDWRIRPLTPPMLLYGVCDVHYLIPLRRLLMRDLCMRDNVTLTVEKDNTIEYIGKSALQGFESLIHPVSSLDRQESVTSVKSEGYFTPQEGDTGNSSLWEGSITLERKIFTTSELRSNSELIHVLRTSQERCLRVWKEENEPLDKNETFISLFTSARRLRSTRTWTEANMALYQVLHQWRDTISRQHGLNPSMVIPLDLLVMIAYRKPRSIPELRQLSYILPVFLAAEETLKHLHELMDIVSLVPGDDILPSLPFTTYSEFVKLVQDDTVINKKGVVSSYSNIIRWTLLSSAALGWLTIVLRKNHR